MYSMYVCVYMRYASIPLRSSSNNCFYGSLTVLLNMFLVCMHVYCYMCLDAC